MFTLPTQKSSVWQIFKNSYTIWRNILSRIILLAFACAIVSSYPHFYIPAYHYPQFTHIIKFIVNNPFTIVFYFIASLIIFTAILYQIKLLINSDKSNPQQALKIGIKKLPFTFFALFASLLSVYLSTQLFVLPGLIMALLLSMYLPLIVFDDEGPFQAYKHSCSLVWHSWWRALIVLALPNLLFWMITYAIEGNAAYEITYSHAHAGKLWLLYHFLWIAINTLYIPWTGAILLLLLHDLKIRKGEKLLPAAVAA